MNVLAKRANGIFILAPILVVTYILLNFILYNLSEEQRDISIVLLFSMGRYGHNNPLTMIYLGYTYAVAGSVVAMIFRFFVCPVIIEYDDYGIYVYKRFKPVEVIRYENLWSQVAILDGRDGPSMLESGLGSEDYYPGCSSITTGTLKIQTTKKTIYLYGVKNARQVEIALNRLVEDDRQKFTEELQLAIEQAKYN